jgi:Flp pilus assembly protein TadD
MGSFRPDPRKAKFLGCSRVALAIALGAVLAGCASQHPEITASVPSANAQMSEHEWRRQLESLAVEYRNKPEQPEVAIAYARALRASGQRAQATAVLQQTSMRNPKNLTVLGAYGRALADVGRFTEALEVLGKAHTPDQPDWRLLNAQGAVLDQMGRHADARRYYETALKIAPNEPSVLSNQALSYALSKELARAEEILRRAAADPRADSKVRQNLGVVLALRSKFDEAESVTRGLLPPEEARSNVAYFRELIRDASRPKSPNAQKTASAG